MEGGLDMVNTCVNDAGLDDLSQRILEVLAREQAENPFTMGLNRPTLIRELGLDPQNHADYMRVKRRLDKLVETGYVECHFLDGMYWFRLGFNEPSAEPSVEGFSKGSDFRRASLHVEHNRRLLLAVKELLEAERVAGRPVFHDLKISHIDVDVGGRKKRVWCLKGKFGLGVYKMPVVIRFYGLNRVLDKYFVKRDRAFYKACRGAIIIVISTSYVEKKALRLLRKLGVAEVFTVNANILMPYTRKERLAEMRRRAEENWKLRIAKSRQRLRGIPKKPPIWMPSEEFIRRFVNRLFKAARRLYTYFRLLLRKWFPSVVMLELQYLDEMRRLLAASKIGSRKGVKIHRLEIERINSLLNQFFQSGKSPPG